MGSEKQVLFPKAGMAEFVDCERPDAPLGPTEIEGRTLCSLISNGTELNVYLGHYERDNLSWGRFPFVPGYATSFTVEAVGAEVTDIKPGQVAYSMGLHRTFQRVERREMLPVPEGLAPESVPFARLMNVTMSTLSTTTARPPALVVVTGLGPIGLMGAKMFGRCGYAVIGVDPVPSRRETASASGVPDVREAAPTDDPKVAGKVALVLECSAHEQAVLDGIKLLQKRGELVQVGVPMTRHTEIYAQELLNAVFRQDCVLRSGTEWEVARHPTAFRANSVFGQMEAALQWMAEGSITTEELFDVLPPTDPQTIYQDILNKRREKPCVVFDWRDIRCPPDVTAGPRVHTACGPEGRTGLL